MYEIQKYSYTHTKIVYFCGFSNASCNKKWASHFRDSFKKQKHWYLINTWSDKAFKGTVVNHHGGSRLCNSFNLVLILVPAQVLSTPETAYLTLKQGEDALLECKVSGNPKPTVTWSKQVNKTFQTHLHKTFKGGQIYVQLYWGLVTYKSNIGFERW